MKRFFPTLDDLMAAPVFDVAGVILELISSQSITQHPFAANLVSQWSQEYGYAGEPRPMNATRVLSEAFAWLENNGFIADDLSPGVGPNSLFVTRAGQRVRARADFLAN